MSSKGIMWDTAHQCPRETLPALPCLAEPVDAPALVALTLPADIAEAFRAACQRLALDPDRVILSAVQRFNRNPPRASLPPSPHVGVRRLSASIPTRLVVALEQRAKADGVTLTAALIGALNVAFATME